MRRLLVLICATMSLAIVQFSLATEPGPIVLVMTARTAALAEPVRLEVSRSRHQLALYRGTNKLKIYPVAVGRAGWETPLGDYKVLQLVRNPAWQHPLTGEVYESDDPGNELGHYWIGFIQNDKGVIGFHGTPHPETVGKTVSHGCVRMFERDIAELFPQVQLGTPVIVRP